MDVLNELPLWSQYLIGFFILLGSIFAFIGSLGLAVLPDFLLVCTRPPKIPRWVLAALLSLRLLRHQYKAVSR